LTATHSEGVDSFIHSLKLQIVCQLISYRSICNKSQVKNLQGVRLWQEVDVQPIIVLE